MNVDIHYHVSYLLEDANGDSKERACMAAQKTDGDIFKWIRCAEGAAPVIARTRKMKSGQADVLTGLSLGLLFAGAALLFLLVAG
jgi:hypothetical protein